MALFLFLFCNQECIYVDIYILVEFTSHKKKYEIWCLKYCRKLKLIKKRSLPLQFLDMLISVLYYILNKDKE